MFLYIKKTFLKLWNLFISLLLLQNLDTYPKDYGFRQLSHIMGTHYLLACSDIISSLFGKPRVASCRTPVSHRTHLYLKYLNP